MNRLFSVFIFVVIICSLNYANDKTIIQHDNADSISHIINQNYYLPIRNEEYKKYNRPYDASMKRSYDLLISSGRVRNYYIVDTLHIPYYYILKNKDDDYHFFVINKKVIEDNFNYENPLDNNGCYLTDSGRLLELIGSITDYFDGPFNISYAIWAPGPLKIKEKLIKGYTLYEPSDEYPDGEKVPPHHVFAVILIKGWLYNYLYSSEHKRDFPFVDDNGYYVLLAPINETIYSTYYKNLIRGIDSLMPQ